MNTLASLVLLASSMWSQMLPQDSFVYVVNLNGANAYYGSSTVRGLTDEYPVYSVYLKRQEIKTDLLLDRKIRDVAGEIVLTRPAYIVLDSFLAQRLSNHLPDEFKSRIRVLDDNSADIPLEKIETKLSKFFKGSDMLKGPAYILTDNSTDSRRKGDRLKAALVDAGFTAKYIEIKRLKTYKDINRTVPKMKGVVVNALNVLYDKESRRLRYTDDLKHSIYDNARTITLGFSEADAYNEAIVLVPDFRSINLKQQANVNLLMLVDTSQFKSFGLEHVYLNKWQEIDESR